MGKSPLYLKPGAQQVLSTVLAAMTPKPPRRLDLAEDCRGSAGESAIATCLAFVRPGRPGQHADQIARDCFAAALALRQRIGDPRFAASSQAALDELGPG